MRQLLGRAGSKTEAVAGLVVLLLLGATPVVAQTLGTDGAAGCRNRQAASACAPGSSDRYGATATRAYDRWQDGSPARPSGSSAPRLRDYGLHYFGGYNAGYGFGR